MTTAWIMAVVSGAATAAVGLAGKGAEHGRCRPTPYCLIVFTIAGGTAFLATLGREAGWGDGRLWLLGGTMGALYLGCIAAMLRANRCWPPSIVWATANMAFVLPLLLSALFLGEPLRPVDIAIAVCAGELLARPQRDRLLICVGDGEPADLPATCRQVQAAQEQGLAVIGLGLGDDSAGMAACIPGALTGLPADTVVDRLGTLIAEAIAGSTGGPLGLFLTRITKRT